MSTADDRTPPAGHHIVVSAENNCYMAWQCKLFHYSCVSRLGMVPVFIVHDLDHKWYSDFVDIVAAGGIVRSAPSYRTTKLGVDYSPRNTAGTLLQASQIGYNPDDSIVLCDADMIFLRRPAFAAAGWSSEGCTNLDYDLPPVREAAQRFGIKSATLTRMKGKIQCSVPHVIPVAHAGRLAKTWLEAIDSFTPGVWETSMYAFGFAIIRLSVELNLTYDVALNDEEFEEIGSAKIIHYSYGNNTWNKRDYWLDSESSKVWEPEVEAPAGTVLAEIINQIRQAKAYYSKVIQTGNEIENAFAAGYLKDTI